MSEESTGTISAKLTGVINSSSRLSVPQVARGVVRFPVLCREIWEGYWNGQMKCASFRARKQRTSTSLSSQTLAISRLCRYRNTSGFSALTLLFCAETPSTAGVGGASGWKQFNKNKLSGFWDSFTDQGLYQTCPFIPMEWYWGIFRVQHFL